MTGTAWRSLRVLVVVAVLGVVLWQTGTGPVIDGFRSLDGWTLVLGAALAVPTTVACAWRWHLVARGLGVGVDLGSAVASCYRSQFLNATLPGGIIGDVHRGVRHGRAAGNPGRGLRAVAWERFAGQVVQGVIALAVLLALPSPVRSSLPVLLGLLGAGVVALLVASHALQTRGSSPVARILHAAADDVRSAVLVRRAWPGVVIASTVAVAGHVGTYLVAARAVGVTAPPERLVPLALLMLVAMGLPLNVAGWGAREGVAAWSFAAAGLGVGHGVATAVAYGAIVTVASLPGAVVLIASSRRGPGRRSVAKPSGAVLVPARQGASHG